MRAANGMSGLESRVCTQRRSRHGNFGPRLPETTYDDPVAPGKQSGIDTLRQGCYVGPTMGRTTPELLSAALRVLAYLYRT